MILFEDINFAGDGGLYAELVKNRSFEFDRPLEGWSVLRRGGAQGRTFVLRDEQKPRNPRRLQVRIESGGEGFGLKNEGFRGMGVRAGENYRFSVQTRRIDGDIAAIRLQLVNGDDRTIGEATVDFIDGEWRTHRATLTAAATDPAARLLLWFEGTGTIELDMISLFPETTWKGRENGLRADLVQLLADMKPGFLRFPGGCIVEGFDLSQMYRWKDTTGPVDERVLNINR